MKKYIKEFLYFGFKQAYASIFGGILLAAILLTKFFWQDDFTIARYDFLFAFAVTSQIFLLLFKLENYQELKVILLFHVIGTIMEVFKTHVGSWVYPEANIIRIGGVPLFTGFMYSAVGSYIARAWKIFDFQFSNYPPKIYSLFLCVAIYINFFTHHYIWDFRYVLFICTFILFCKTRIYFKLEKTYRWMHLLIGFGLVSFFIWIAENFGTLGNIWLYPNQKEVWELVSFTKMGSWYLLMIISFVFVTLIHDIKRINEK